MGKRAMTLEPELMESTVEALTESTTEQIMGTVQSGQPGDPKPRIRQLLRGSLDQIHELE